MATKRHLFFLVAVLIGIGYGCYAIDEYIGDWAFIPLVALIVGGILYSRK